MKTEPNRSSSLNPETGQHLDGRRVLVTGANGFVGSNLCEQLVRCNCEVTAFVRRSTASEPINIAHLKSRLRICYGDLRDFTTVYDTTKGIDVIYHLGAQSHVPDSVRDPHGVFQVNGIGTINCLEAARLNDVDVFVNAGSDKVYGDPLDLPLNERHPARPRSPYDASKLAAEAICMAYHKTYGLKVCLPRFSNIYGPRQDGRKVIPNLIGYLLHGQSPVIRSDGTLVRDYLFVEEAVDAYLRLVEDPKLIGEVINFGTGVGTSVLDLCNLLIETSRIGVRPTILGQPIPGEIRKQYLDISKAKNMLRWSPRTTLREGLSSTWQWYSAHPDYLALGCRHD